MFSSFLGQRVEQRFEHREEPVHRMKGFPGLALVSGETPVHCAKALRDPVEIGAG